jgi:hypothetical protein
MPDADLAVSNRAISNASAHRADAGVYEEEMKQLICLGAKAYGVGTFGDITGYFNTDGWRDRMSPGPWSVHMFGQRVSKLTGFLMIAFPMRRKMLGYAGNIFMRQPPPCQ